MTHIPAAPAAVDYLLLTPGPLSTTPTVRAAMLQDSCTWDADYNLGVVEPIRRELVRLAMSPEYAADYSAVLLQGSGSYVVESVLGSALGPDDCLLIINNGAYGARMVEMACATSNSIAARRRARRWRPSRPCSASTPGSPTWPWCTARPPPAC